MFRDDSLFEPSNWLPPFKLDDNLVGRKVLDHIDIDKAVNSVACYVEGLVQLYENCSHNRYIYYTTYPYIFYLYTYALVHKRLYRSTVLLLRVVWLSELIARCEKIKPWLLVFAMRFQLLSWSWKFSQVYSIDVLRSKTNLHLFRPFKHLGITDDERSMYWLLRMDITVDHIWMKG